MKILLLILALSSIACLQTAIIADAPTPAPSTPTAILPEETEAHEVLTAESQPLKATCAIVTAIQSLNLREKPSEKSAKVTEKGLPAKNIVIIIGKVGDWWKVESALGTGYARADYLKETECE